VYPDLLWEVSRIALPPAEVIDLLLGAPLPTVEYQLGAASGAEDGRIEVALVDSQGVALRHLVFDAGGLLRSVDAIARGRVSWSARFDDYAPIGDEPFAHEILVDFPVARTSASVSLRDVELNPDVDPDVFHLNLAPFEGSPGG
jgi:hypothetical protein